MPVGMILMAQAAGPQRIGRVMSVIGVPMIMAPVLGPALGGLIVDNFSWRWIFFVNLPIGILGLVMGRRLLPRSAAKADPGRLDLGGLALLSPGLALVVFGLSEVATKGGLSSTESWLPIVVGLVLVAAFARHALRASNPLIDLRLFGDRALAAAASTTFLTAAALFGSLLLLPLFFQVARGQSALDAGLLQAPQGLGVALIMPWSGRLTDRIGGGRVAFFGLIALTVATIPLALMTSGTPLWAIDAILFARGLALGCSMMPSMAAAYAALDHSAVPRATSALNVLQRVGGSIGTAVLAVVLQHSITTRIPGASGGGLDAGAALPPAARAHVAAPLNAAFASTFWWAVALTAVAVVPALLLMRVTRGVAEERASGVPAAAAGD
jgi:EmrB/QacA subfamily drug resistance transporter